MIRQIGKIQLTLPNTTGAYRVFAGISATPEEMVDAAVHWEPRSDGEAPWLWFGMATAAVIAGQQRVILELPIDVKSRRKLLSGMGTSINIESGGSSANITEINAWVRTLVLKN